MNFYDSIRIFNVPLKKLPSTFLDGQFDMTLRKQHFPFKMLSQQSLDYSGPWPSKDMYILDRMNRSELEEFNQWHAEMSSQEFNMRNTVIEYCSTDSLILFLALLSLQKLIIQITSCPHLPQGVDPLRNCPTISSLALKIFRMVHLKEEHLVTLVNSNTDDVQIVKGIRQGTQMSLEIGKKIITADELTDYEIKSTHMLKSSIALLPPVHTDCTKRNRFSKEGMSYVLYYEERLRTIFGKQQVTAYHALSNGEWGVRLDQPINSKTYLDGYFVIDLGHKKITHALMFNGCW